MVINTETPIVGVVEWTALKLDNNKISLLANELVEQLYDFYLR